MKKIYIATVAAAVATTAIFAGILLMQTNGTSANNAVTASSQNGQNNIGHSIAKDSKAGNDVNTNFGPPDDGGYGDGDQLLG